MRRKTPERKHTELYYIYCACGTQFVTTNKRRRLCVPCSKDDTIYQRFGRFNDASLPCTRQYTKRLARYGIEPGHTYQEWLGQLKKQNYLCYYCQRTMTKFFWTKDHKIPLKRGGNDFIENIVACCRTCNSKKGTMTDQEFINKYGNELGVVEDERKFRKTEDALEDYAYIPATYEDQNFFGKSNSQLVVVSSIQGRIGNRTAE